MAPGNITVGRLAVERRFAIELPVRVENCPGRRQVSARASLGRRYKQHHRARVICSVLLQNQGLSPMEQAEVGPCLQVTGWSVSRGLDGGSPFVSTSCPSMLREFLLGTGIRPESSEHQFTNVAFHSFIWDVVLSVDEAF